MKKISPLYLMLILVFLSCQTQKMKTTPQAGYLAESQVFEFYNHFWLNLHHFLYTKADLYTKKSIEESLTPSAWKQTSALEKEALTLALIFYRDHIIKEDLRTGDNLYAFKTWVITQKEKPNLSNHESFKQQIEVLNNVRKVYEKYWWPEHKKSNVLVLENNKALINKLELSAKKRLIQLAKNEWQSGKIRVDICYYAKLGRPYTSIKPTHIVMNVRRNAQPAGNWFELLLHEASHHFIFPNTGFVGETINQAVNELGMKAPRGLWHAYLFYFTGKTAQELLVKEGLQDYELYMIRRNVFQSFYPLLAQYLPAYLDGEQSLLECTKQIISDFQEKKE